MLNRINHAVAFYLLIGFAIAILSACNYGVIDSASNDADSRVTSHCRIVHHELGETCIPTNPQRIVTLSVATLAHALTLGVQPVGSTNDYEQPGSFANYPYLEKQTKEIITLGNPAQPDLERLLQLKPDLIIGWGGYSAETIYPTLSKIAPTVLYDWQKLTWRDQLKFVAGVLGKQATAQKELEKYDRRLQNLKSVLSNPYQNQTISIALLYFGRFGSLVHDSFVGSILQDLQLKRPKTQDRTAPFGYIEFSDEYLDLIDGDVLFVVTRTESDRRRFAQLRQQPLWNHLQVVQRDRVYPVSSAWTTGQDLIAADVILDDLENYLAQKY